MYVYAYHRERARDVFVRLRDHHRSHLLSLEHVGPEEYQMLVLVLTSLAHGSLKAKGPKRL